MYLYGASGHGKVIKEILESQGKAVDGFVDDNPETRELTGVPVQHHTEGVDEVIVSIGINETRKSIAENMKCRFADAAVHKRAIVSDTATLGKGTVVMASAVVNAGAKVGRHCIINTGASVDHDCTLGDYVHIAPHATLCGLISVGEGTLIGAGASVVPCVKIGRWCVIGAGSAVIEDIPDYSVAVGVPARVISTNETTKNYEREENLSELGSHERGGK